MKATLINTIVGTLDFIGLVLTSFQFWALLVWALAYFWFRRGKPGQRRIRAAILVLPSWKLLIAIYVFVFPLRGTVIEAETGKPMKGAIVVGSWYGVPGIVVRSCWGTRWQRSDENGEFSFRLVPALASIHYFAEKIEVRYPGRYSKGEVIGFPWRTSRTYPVRKYVVEEGFKMFDRSERSCGVAKGVPHGIEGMYREMYRAACIRREPWTATNHYFLNLADAWSWEWLRRSNGSGYDPRYQYVSTANYRLYDAKQPGGDLFFPGGLSSAEIDRECAALAAPPEFLPIARP